MTYEQRLRTRLVRQLQRAGVLRDERVAEAFTTVPRQVFVPGRALTEVYSDQAIITKTLDGVGVSSSSQPAVMAVMLEQLQLARGLRVLEIGAGTGYNAALIARLVGRTGRVTTVDIDPEIASEAGAHLRAAGIRNARAVAGDGGYGHATDAPYDRIIATASCWQIPEPWLEQLVDGGLLVFPFRLNGAHVGLALRKQGQELVSTSALMCGFMPLRGAFGPTYERRLGQTLASADVPISARTWRALERMMHESRNVRVRFPRRRDAGNTPLYYIALQGVPVLRYFRQTSTWGEAPFLLMTSSTSAIALPWLRPPRGRLPTFGSSEAFDWLRATLAAWRDEGQPDTRQLRARVRPSRARLGPLPKRSNGRYRFARGAHVYELWFKR